MNNTLFQRESEKIYSALFRSKIPETALTRFIIASKKLNEKLNERELENYYNTISRISDLESLEIAARYFKKLPLLVLKFRGMVYIAETLPENQKYFLNDKSNFLKGLLALINGGINTAYKLLKGYFLIRKIKNV
jgi:hypothetical protein